MEGETLSLYLLLLCFSLSLLLLCFSLSSSSSLFLFSSSSLFLSPLFSFPLYFSWFLMISHKNKKKTEKKERKEKKNQWKRRKKWRLLLADYFLESCPIQNFLDRKNSDSCIYREREWMNFFLFSSSSLSPSFPLSLSFSLPLLSPFSCPTFCPLLFFLSSLFFCSFWVREEERKRGWEREKKMWKRERETDRKKWKREEEGRQKE